MTRIIPARRNTSVFVAMEQRQAVHGIAFKAIPTEPVRLAFRKELK